MFVASPFAKYEIFIGKYATADCTAAIAATVDAAAATAANATDSSVFVND